MRQDALRLSHPQYYILEDLFITARIAIDHPIFAPSDNPTETITISEIETALPRPIKLLLHSPIFNLEACAHDIHLSLNTSDKTAPHLVGISAIPYFSLVLQSITTPIAVASVPLPLTLYSPLLSYLYLLNLPMPHIADQPQTIVFKQDLDTELQFTEFTFLIRSIYILITWASCRL